MKETLKEKLLSRQFGAALSFFCVTTFILFYMVFIKCEGEIYDHESALKYFDLWCEYNIWNLIAFGSMDGLKKVAQYLPTKNKPPQTNEQTA
jgi:hypothetical protein